MADYDPTQCLKDLQDSGMTPTCQTLTPAWHCEDLTTAGGAYHRFCGNAGIMYQPIPMLYCGNPQTGISQYFPPDTMFAQCSALGAPWQGGTCYCCCSCFANDTMIGTPHGNKEIYLISKGEEVLAGSLVPNGGKTQVEWSRTGVSFSSGTSAHGHQPLMVYLSLRGKDRQELLCNMDQPFLLADGKFTKAGKLHPGQQLVDKDGNPLTVELISIGAYNGGVHHISTEAPWSNDPSGHLLLAGGVVAGDYTLQLHFDHLPAWMKEPQYDAKPLIGTPAYEEVHGGKLNRSDVFFEFVGANVRPENSERRQLASGLFKTYRVAAKDIPYGAQSLFTPDQAIDIAKNGAQTPLSNPIPMSTFNTITAQISGFFPDIDFYYEPLETLPNVYAFEAYGKKVVVITGGLARMKQFSYEGMFMAIAHGVSCFYGGAPTNGFGYAAVGQSDWFAFGVISRLVWIGQPYVSYITGAMAQWNALFEFVSPEHAQGNPLDPLNDPSLDCRFKTIQSAAGGGNLPECAGGAPLPKISLQKATALPDGEVTVNLSLAVEPKTGTNVANYVLSPKARVTSAMVDRTTGFIVHLEADLKAGTKYELTVQNLVSILGSGVDPERDSTTFQSPEA